MAYISTATPIKENGKELGVISFIVSNNKIDILRTGAADFPAVSEELSATSEEMAAVSNLTGNELQGLSEESQSLKIEIKNIENILNIIKDTAIRSRILSLNAAIETTRSREYDKGFTVVTNEIKKMTDKSKAQAMVAELPKEEGRTYQHHPFFTISNQFISKIKNKIQD